MHKKGESIYNQLNDKEWLYNRYWVEHLNSRDIAEAVGCNLSTVCDALRRKGIRIRTLSEAKTGNKYCLGRCLSKETRDKMSFSQRRRNAIKGVQSSAQRRMNKAMKTGIWFSLKGAKRGRHWETLVGYSIVELMGTLEKDFQKGMNWKNYGKWHIDHIIPLAHFHYDSPEDPEFKKAWALNNLQPLWAKQNSRKKDKYMFF